MLSRLRTTRPPSSGRSGASDETRRGPGAAPGVLVEDHLTLHQEAVRPWEGVTSPLQVGAFPYRMHYLVTESFGLYDETFASRVRPRGQSPPDVLAFPTPICSPSDSLCRQSQPPLLVAGRA